MAENAHPSALIDIDRTIRCSYLLPDPGGEVVRELATEIKRLRAQIAELEASVNRQDAKP